MKTHLWTIDPAHPSFALLQEAAAYVREGKLVAFPTETVYGLGANGLDSDAVAKIYAAKGRPATNPVILHVATMDQAKALTNAWTPEAQKLADAFWPGPLTMILKKSEIVPAIVTAGGMTVAVRMPLHPIALALIREAGVPLAAPSANLSGSVSPTTAAHVLKTLDGSIDGIIDAGSAERGLESTVLDLTVTPPMIRRPGPVSRAEIEAVIGPVRIDADVHDETRTLISPGQMQSHYAPRAMVHCIPVYPEGQMESSVHALREHGASVACMLRTQQPIDGVPSRMLPHDAAGYAAALYDALHALDETGVRHILVEMPPDTEEWAAVLDRLKRASAPR